jgi:hypothetical protein
MIGHNSGRAGFTHPFALAMILFPGSAPDSTGDLGYLLSTVSQVKEEQRGHFRVLQPALPLGRNYFGVPSDAVHAG